MQKKYVYAFGIMEKPKVINQEVYFGRQGCQSGGNVVDWFAGTGGFTISTEVCKYYSKKKTKNKRQKTSKIQKAKYKIQKKTTILRNWKDR
jgi:hypothetical protein